jgi:outer membrane protein OmpA-like peptidoglycan-associated protein
MNNRNLITILLMALTALSLSACANSKTPDTLSQARQTMEMAKEEGGNVYAPTHYDEANRALTKAEKSFDDNGNDAETKTLTHVATRKAQATLAATERNKLDMEARERRGDLFARLDRAMDGFAVVRYERDTTVVAVSDEVLFAYDEAELTDLARRELSQLADALKSSPNTYITIEGHADSTGSEDYNQELSMERAREVRSYLIEQGISGTRVAVRALGENDPIANNDTPQGRANNRRVEIIVQSQLSQR